MKRLKKKSAGKVTLYHATSSQILMQIAQDGQILPGGYVGKHTNTFVNTDGEQRNPSDQNGVYLYDGDKGYMGDLFADNASLFAVLDAEKPNIPVILEVYVDTDALGPDYDDTSTFGLADGTKPNEIGKVKQFLDNYSDEEEYWKKSIDMVGHVVHQGPIDSNEIKSVKFDLHDLQDVTKIGAQLNDMMNVGVAEVEYLEDFFNGQESVEYSFNEAINVLNKLYEQIDYDNSGSGNIQENTANKVMRLKKLNKGGK